VFVPWRRAIPVCLVEELSRKSLPRALVKRSLRRWRGKRAEPRLA
jgi:hypothetical protein